jgi:hypothetical protein
MRGKESRMNRRQFLNSSGGAMAGSAGTLLAAGLPTSRNRSTDHPNLIFVTADQTRAQSFGYMGNSQVHTPNFAMSATLPRLLGCKNWPGITPSTAGKLWAAKPYALLGQC